MSAPEKKPEPFPEFLYVKREHDNDDPKSESWYVPDEVEASLAEIGQTTIVARYQLVEVNEVFGGIVHSKKIGPER